MTVMIRFTLGALLSLYAFAAAAQTSPADSIAFVTAEWRVSDLGGGARCRYAQVDMFGSRQSIPGGALKRGSFISTVGPRL